MISRLKNNGRQLDCKCQEKRAKSSRLEMGIFLNFKPNFYLLTSLILFFVFSLQFTQAQHLDDYLKKASENNPGLKASYTTFEAAMQKIPQVKVLADPTLSFGYFISPIETRVGPQKAKISLNQMFPWFGTLAVKEEVVTHQAEAKYQEFLNTKNKLFFNVKASYYALYEVHEQIRWQEENLDILTTFKKLATTSFSNGKGAMTDVIRVDIMIGNTNVDIQLLKDQLSPLETAFKALLNDVDSTYSVVIDTISITPMRSNCKKDSLLFRNPKLQMIDKEIFSATSSEEMIKKQGLPSFGIGLDYAIVDKRSDLNVPDNGKNAFMPMVSMSLPVFRGKYKASLKAAQLRQTTLRLKREDMKNSLLSTYDMTVYKMEKAKMLNDLYEDQMVKTQQIINLFYKSYSNSGSAFEEILQMQQQLLKYKTSKATVTKNYFTALAELDYLTAKSE